MNPRNSWIESLTKTTRQRSWPCSLCLITFTSTCMHSFPYRACPPPCPQFTILSISFVLYLPYGLLLMNQISSHNSRRVKKLCSRGHTDQSDVTTTAKALHSAIHFSTARWNRRPRIVGTFLFPCAPPVWNVSVFRVFSLVCEFF